MARRNKLQKFADIASFPNVYENFHHDKPHLLGVNGQEVELKGKWSKEHFKNDHPLTLELACGRGEYTLQLSEHFPDRNFVGVDVKGARIWKGARVAIEKELTNAAFLRTQIEQITLFFAPAEVDEIWITFPDPFLKSGKENRRLTGARFLDSFRTILKPQGIIHLKTDSPELYEFTLEVMKTYDKAKMVINQDDIYSEDLVMPELNYKTYYEDMHLKDGRKIKYVRLQML